jgi:hypothetical protein
MMTFPPRASNQKMPLTVNRFQLRNAFGTARNPEHCPRFADGNRDALSTIKL